MLRSIPTDMFKKILYKVPADSLFEMCETDKYVQIICEDETFWRQYVELNYDPKDYKINTDWDTFRKFRVRSDKNFRIFTFKDLALFLTCGIKQIRQVDKGGNEEIIILEKDSWIPYYQGEFIGKDKEGNKFTLISRGGHPYINKLKVKQQPNYFSDYVPELDVTLFDAIEEYQKFYTY